MTPTTRKLSDRHEEYLADVFGGRKTRGSGNQPNDQMDGKQSYGDEHYVFAWDGKATLGKSISVTRQMVHKAIEQSHWARTMIPLRFYADARLTEVEFDLAVIQVNDLAEMMADANAYRRLKAGDP